MPLIFSGFHIGNFVRCVALGVALLICGMAPGEAAGADPLPSWNDGATKQSIIDYVARVTKEGGPDFVAPKDRLATFDNDGTLWIEMPMYNQFVFAMDEVKAQATQHPEWKTKEPFKSVLAGDMVGWRPPSIRALRCSIPTLSTSR